jgi:hypothetical protein
MAEEETLEPEILDIDEAEEGTEDQPEIVGIEAPEEVEERNSPEIITVEETDEATEDGPPEIVDVDEMEEVEDAGDEAVEEIEEVEEVRPATRRPPTTKRPRTTSRSLRDRRDRPGTQRMGTRKYGQSSEQKAKLIVIAVTAGLLLVLIVAALGKAFSKQAPRKEKKTVYIKHKLDNARSLRREGEALIRKASSAGSPQAKNNYLGQAMQSLRRAQSEYTGLIEQYQGPQYEYLHRESQQVMKLLYHCQKSMTLQRR